MAYLNNQIDYFKSRKRPADRAMDAPAPRFNEVLTHEQMECITDALERKMKYHRRAAEKCSHINSESAQGHIEQYHLADSAHHAVTNESI